MKSEIHELKWVRITSVKLDQDIVAEQMKEASQSLAREMVMKSFVKRSISNTMVGTEYELQFKDLWQQKNEQMSDPYGSLTPTDEDYGYSETGVLFNVNGITCIHESNFDHREFLGFRNDN